MVFTKENNVSVKYSFAKQYLEERGVEVYSGKERILQRKLGKPNLKYGSINTRIKIGKELIDREEKIYDIKPPDLLNMGYTLASRKIGKHRYSYKQRVEYYITKNVRGIKLERFPNFHVVKFSPSYQRIKLVGPNAGPLGEGKWINLKTEKKGEYKKEYSAEDYYDRGSSILEKYEKNISSLDEEEEKFMDIPEIPVLFSETGELVCIKKEDDIPTIGFVGKRGSGKSYTMHSVIDHIVHKMKERVIFINDSLNQTATWSKKNSDTGQAHILSRINEVPTPLPCVFIYPQVRNMKKDNLEEEGIGVRMSISFKQLIRNYTYTLQGKKEWDLGNSQKYLQNMKEEISGCKSYDDVEYTVSTEMGKLIGEGTKGLKGTITKILACMRDVFDYNFLNISSGVPSHFTFKTPSREFKETLYTGLMDVGVVPIIVTSHLKRFHFYPQYERLIIDKTFNDQITKSKGRTWIAADEVGDIIKKGTKKTVASEAFINCVTGGRQPQLGTLYNTQNYSKLDEEIRNNTSYLFSGIYSSSEEVNAICRDFDLPDRYKGKNGVLTNLEKGEIVVMTNDRKFVVYTPDGDRYETSGVFRGIPVPTLSEHMRPGLKL